MALKTEQLLDPAYLATISNYALLAKIAVEGYISGQHRSLFHGFGSEFLQYRAYSPGEDPRYIDWKAYARSGRLQTKVYQEETNMNCYLVLDASASMNYQGNRSSCSKFHYAKMITAALAYLASKQGDNVGLYVYNDTMIEAIAPGHSSNRLASIFHSLANLTPQGGANHQHAHDFLSHHLKSRGLYIMISDFLESEDTMPDILSRFRIRHFDTIALQILDPDETDFPKDAAARFVDLETQSECVTSPATVADDFNSAMQEATSRLSKGFAKTRVDYRQISTADSLGQVIANYLYHRKQIG